MTKRARDGHEELRAACETLTARAEHAEYLRLGDLVRACEKEAQRLDVASRRRDADPLLRHELARVRQLKDGFVIQLADAKRAVWESAEWRALVRAAENSEGARTFLARNYPRLTL